MENKLQLAVSYDEDGELKKKNYTHSIGEDVDQSKLKEATSALSLVLGKEIKGYHIAKSPLI